MSKLVRLSSEGATDKHVVFIHGLRKSGTQIWHSASVPPELWPLWLNDDIPNLCIWSIEHDSAKTKWGGGHAMPLFDRARNVASLLRSESQLRSGDLFFVVHSFGGLIVEELVRTADAEKDQTPDMERLLKRSSARGSSRRRRKSGHGRICGFGRNPGPARLSSAAMQSCISMSWRSPIFSTWG